MSSRLDAAGDFALLMFGWVLASLGGDFCLAGLDCWALALSICVSPPPSGQACPGASVLPKKPPTPEGQGGPRRTSSAALLAGRVGSSKGVLTLVLSIWKAEIRFFTLDSVPLPLCH